MNIVHHAAAYDVLRGLPDASVDLIYVDPPFGTGRNQTLARKKNGTVTGEIKYEDPKIDYMNWIEPHLLEFHRVLKPSGTMYLHLDHHWVHRVKVLLDDVIFGEECFLNEIVWAYDFGGRGKRCWPKKHDSILVYVKQKDNHVFNWDDIERIPYMAPGLQKDPARAEAGKVPTDVWWMSIVGTQAKERNGYPTQKPIKLVERAVLASSPVGGLVLDVFAGSGTTGEAALLHGRSFVLADTSPWAIEVMQARFKDRDVEWKLYERQE